MNLSATPQYDTGVATAAYQYVDWTNMECASGEVVHNETELLHHDWSIDNDALNRTFMNTSAYAAAGMDFTVADKFIDISADNCYGTFLNTKPDADGTSYWQMTVLTDGITDGIAGDLVYAAIIEDDATGFNGVTYDYQILLPQDGNVLQGAGTGTTDDSIKSNTEYYFYVELIGEVWPSND